MLVHADALVCRNSRKTIPCLICCTLPWPPLRDTSFRTPLSPDIAKSLPGYARGAPSQQALSYRRELSKLPDALGKRSFHVLNRRCSVDRNKTKPNACSISCCPCSVGNNACRSGIRNLLPRHSSYNRCRPGKVLDSSMHVPIFDSILNSILDSILEPMWWL